MSYRLHLLLPLVAACGGTPTVNLGSNLPDATSTPDTGVVDSAPIDGSFFADAGLADTGAADVGTIDGSFFPDVGFATDSGEEPDATIGGDDLDIVWVSIPNPLNPAPGVPANLMVEARNLGANARASTVSIRLCSGPCSSSPSAMELARVPTGQIASASTVILTIPVTIPGFFTRGVFNLEAMIDPDQSLAEFSETNNIDATPITIGVPALDFAPSIVNFGGVSIGNAGLTSVIVTNPANGAISGSWEVSSATDPAFFASSSSSNPFTLPPNGTFPIDLSFMPSRLGPHRGAILITVDPDTAPSIAIPLWGYGL